MCFNISVNLNKSNIEYEFDAGFETNSEFEFSSHVSAFTNPFIPVVTSENIRKIELCRWGLVPKWVKNSIQANNIRQYTYNAKSETVFDKPSFRDSIVDKKCLIIIDGFYEWQSTRSGKVCHLITHSSSKIFTLAGIWSDWTDKITGEVLRSVSILTQPANQFMSRIHNTKHRQPVLINKEDRMGWINSREKINNILNRSLLNKLQSQIVLSPLKNN